MTRLFVIRHLCQHIGSTTTNLKFLQNKAYERTTLSSEPSTFYPANLSLAAKLDNLKRSISHSNPSATCYSVMRHLSLVITPR